MLWRNRPIEGYYPYVYLDGIVLKRSWAGEIKNVSVLVAVGVDQDGYRRILGVAEGQKEDKAGWSSFLAYLKQRGLKGVKLVISDACLGLVESVTDHYPEADWQSLHRALLPQRLQPRAQHQGQASCLHAQGYPRPGKPGGGPAEGRDSD